MQLTIEPGLPPGSETQIILRCVREDESVHALAALLQTQQKRIPAAAQGETRLLEPGAVLYAESVDGATFLYTAQEVCKTPWSLAALEEALAADGFFRCSKSMVLNLHAVAALRPGTNGKLVARLQNEERLLVSRHYAGKLRARLAQ